MEQLPTSDDIHRLRWSTIHRSAFLSALIPAIVTLAWSLLATRPWSNGDGGGGLLFLPIILVSVAFVAWIVGYIIAILIVRRQSILANIRIAGLIAVFLSDLVFGILILWYAYPHFNLFGPSCCR